MAKQANEHKKKYKLELLQPAQKELEQIARIHMELVGPNSARKITDTIYTALENLMLFPDLGILCEVKVSGLEGFRMQISGKYLCIYKRHGDTIFVYRIVDGRSNYPRHLRNIFQEGQV